MITNFTGSAGQTYSLDATATNSVGTSGFSNVVTFTILIGTPAAPSSFHLDPATDTGIVGDGITNDRTPSFIGTDLPGETVNLYVVGSSTIWDANVPSTSTVFTGTVTSGSAVVSGITSTAGLFVGENVTAAGILPSGTTIQSINSSTSTVTLSANATASGSQNLTATSFAVQLPFSLTNGTISLYVQAVDPAGNVSPVSNTLTVTIVSVASDYNGDSYSDAALYSRGTISFTGTLTSGSPLLTGLSSLTGLVTGVTISWHRHSIGNDDRGGQHRQFHWHAGHRLGVWLRVLPARQGFLPVRTLRAQVSPPGRRSRLSTARLRLHCRQTQQSAALRSSPRPR